MDAIDGPLFTSSFGRYNVRVFDPERVELYDKWQNSVVYFFTDLLLKSNMDEIHCSLRMMEDGIRVNKRWYIGAAVKVKSPSPFALIGNLRLDRAAWSEWTNVCSELKEKFPLVKTYSMSPAHADILRRNRVFLMHNLDVSIVLIQWLRSRRILTEEMVETIGCCRYATNTEKVVYLLDLLPRRGPNAFHQFVEGLIITNQCFVVDKLLI